MAPRRSAPPPSPPQVESSEESDSGSSAFESEEEIAHSLPAPAPMNPAPLPQMVQQPEASDEEEDEDVEEEEEEDKAVLTATSSATKNLPPSSKREESESDEEEEEETNDETPQSMSVPKLQAKVMGENPPPSSQNKKRRDFSEICQMYPYLAEQMKALGREWPGLFNREFSMIDDENARKLDQKIKKQRVQQMQLELRRRDVDKEVTKTLMDLLK